MKEMISTESLCQKETHRLFLLQSYQQREQILKLILDNENVSPQRAGERISVSCHSDTHRF